MEAVYTKNVLLILINGENADFSLSFTLIWMVSEFSGLDLLPSLQTFCLLWNLFPVYGMNLFGNNISAGVFSQPTCFMSTGLPVDQ